MTLEKLNALYRNNLEEVKELQKDLDKVEEQLTHTDTLTVDEHLRLSNGKKYLESELLMLKGKGKGIFEVRELFFNIKN